MNKLFCTFCLLFCITLPTFAQSQVTINSVTSYEQFVKNYATIERDLIDTANSGRSPLPHNNEQLSNKYEYVLTNHGLNPFTAPLESLIAESESNKKFINNLFDQLTSTENSLEKKYLELFSSGYTPQSFIVSISDMLDKLKTNPSNQSAIENNNKHIQILKQSAPKLRSFNYEYNQFTQNALDISMAFTLDIVKSDIIYRRQNNLNIEGIEKEYLDMKKSILHYLVNKPRFSTTKDVKRLSPNAKFFHKAQKYFAKPIKEPFSINVSKAFNLLKKSPHAILLSAKIIQALYILIRNPKARQNVNPFTKALSGIMNSIAKIINVKTEVIGRENIPERGNDNVRRVIIANHTHGLLDQVALAAVGINTVGILAAVNNFLPSFIQGRPRQMILNLANKNNSIIVVGEGSKAGTVEQVLELARTNPNLDIMYYPSGTLGDGFRFSNEARANASTINGIIDGLMNEGYSIKMIPLAKPYNGRGHDGKTHLAKNNPSNDLLVDIRPQINSDVIKFFLKHGGSYGFADYLRLGYFESTMKHSREGLLWGAVKANSMQEYIHRLLKTDKSKVAIRYCKQISSK